MKTNVETNVEANAVSRIKGLSDLSNQYSLVLCDVWGVLHNGVKAYEGAIEALSAFRKNGGTVVMVTNAPRPRGPVYAQLKRLGVPEGVYDEVVTSGDATQALMRQAPKKMHFIGVYEKDKNLFEGLDIELVGEDEAQAIICTGPFDEDNDIAADYIPVLKKFRKRNLPFICANPDKVVEIGDRFIMCGGAIADEYEKLGGETLIAGKPHAPIYEQAIKEASSLTGKTFEKSDILAIGDGMPTDIKGAQDFGLDVLYISAGIHAGEYGDADEPNDGLLQKFLVKNNAKPVAYIPRLQW
ncbi:MAG: TIGR01459 family HAD-type hydrolase [Hyphomicrobiales bacterium]|nr:TIGR01459 family HAD-type hydrolase [Hyphomicrobiales bacterium]PCH50047.1 MAG: TIGR01459 family HAD-type hydrolase [Hyphomicrobiales bacterium]PCH50486.1 MAG: TIGR01459 family HAD-type hydrolase [Hyphomicrobiales bacterium]